MLIKARWQALPIIYEVKGQRFSCGAANALGETDLLIMNVNVNVMFRCEPGDYEASQVKDLRVFH